MIDLTPLDVRKKKGDFRRGMRGYETAVVDDFLDLVAERMEELVRETAQLRERLAGVSEAMLGYQERERAMNEALVSAQQLREEVRVQATREAELVLREAQVESERLVGEARLQATAAMESARRIHTQRGRYLRAYRAFVERQLAEIEQEEERLRDLQRGDGDGLPERRAADADADASVPE